MNRSGNDNAMNRISLPGFALFFSAFFILQVTAGSGTTIAQEGSATSSLTVTRATVQDFVGDATITGSEPKESGSSVLPSIFVISSASTGQMIFWSPTTCRLLAVKNGEARRATGALLSKELLAEGAHPFAITIGAAGEPRFFGFRIKDNAPEFLYTFGQISVEEKFSLSSDGTKLYQTFRVSIQSASGAIRFPEPWRKLAEANKGTWNSNVLAVSKEDMSEGFTVTYRLDPG